MSAMIPFDIDSEVELMERYVRSCRRQFATAIAGLNRRPAADTTTPEMQCLRLCVEALDMVLVNQDRLGRALRRLSGTMAARRAA